MGLNFERMRVRVPLFKILVIFAITFFVYNDFGIKMLYGYGMLILSIMTYLGFTNGRIKISSNKTVYLILSFVLAGYILGGSSDRSDIVFAIAITLCAVLVLVGDVRYKELSSVIAVLLIAATAMSLYVITVRMVPSLYTNYVSSIISGQSDAVNRQMLKDGYGITLGGNIVFIDYVLNLAGLICANVIMTYKRNLKHKWIYWGCAAIFLVGMLFENRKSEMLAFIIALFACFFAHMKGSDIKEQRRLRHSAIVITIIAVAGLIYLASHGYLDRYMLFIERLLGNAHSSSYQVDVTSGRLELWALALKLFLEHPVFGVGWGHFEDYLPANLSNLSNVHNNYLQLLCETGVVGFLLIVVPMVLLLINTIKQWKTIIHIDEPEPLSIVATSTAFGLQISFLILSLLDPCWYKMSFWPFFAISVMLSNFSIHISREGETL